MLSGTTIDNLVVGGPAYNSKQLARGDVILQVNNIPATKANIYELLVGDDRPGSTVVINVSKGGLQA
jgi:C-terminal processing protease CtpA/Prc